jgi:hypothetical protein
MPSQQLSSQRDFKVLRRAHSPSHRNLLILPTQCLQSQQLFCDELCVLSLDSSTLRQTNLTPSVFSCKDRIFDVGIMSSSRKRKSGCTRSSASPLHTTHVHQINRPPVSLQYEPSISPLLKLPGELRNRIYQLALTTSKGIHLDPSNPTQFLDADVDVTMAYEDRRPVNLLKFTCRQLYQETAGIEVKFNRVEYSGYHQSLLELHGPNRSPGPAQAFNDFLSNCTATKATWLREVTLYFQTRLDRGPGTFVESETELLAVDEFCRNHPRVNVRYVPHWFDASVVVSRRFILAGAYLSLQFRGKDLRHSIQRPGALSPGESLIWGHFQWLCDKKTKFTISAPNFRFWPKSHELDQAAFRRDITKWDPWLEADVCLELATDWINNGL